MLAGSPDRDLIVASRNAFRLGLGRAWRGLLKANRPSSALASVSAPSSRLVPERPHSDMHQNAVTSRPLPDHMSLAQWRCSRQASVSVLGEAVFIPGLISANTGTLTAM